MAETPPISETGSTSCNADKFATSDGSCANASSSVDIREVCSLVGPHCAGYVYGQLMARKLFESSYISIFV